MILCIDAGNSMTHCALFDGAQLMEKEACPAAEGLPALARRGRGGVRRVLLASVAPSRSERLARLAEDATGVRAEVFGRDVDVPIAARVAHPRRVGVDRLLDALAAHRREGAACVVVDAGTAVTVDLVDAGGAFCGGAISPGPGMMLQAMSHGAEMLPSVGFARPQAAVGKETAEAIRSGAYWGTVGLIGELIRRVASEAEGPCRVVATGGWMSELAPDLPAVDAVAPDLTLEGMAAAAALLADRGSA